MESHDASSSARGADPGTAAETRAADTGPICTVPRCDRPVYVRGLCEVHWADPRK